MIIPRISPGLKTDLVRRLLSGSSLQAGLDSLSADELVAAFRFIYEKTVEFCLLAQGGSFPQEELLRTGQHFPLAAAADCRQAHVCQPLDCVHHQPVCARSRLILQMDRLCELARTVLQQSADSS